jgi:hypothetical protein
MWYKIAQNRNTGFKIVGFANGKAYSLANPKLQYNLAIGSTTGDTFLGTTEQFVKDYYSGTTDDQELLLVYSYDPADIVSGGDSANGGEVRVSRAKLESFKPLA